MQSFWSLHRLNKELYWLIENIQKLPKSLKKLILWIVQDPLAWRVGGRASKERWRTDLGLILKKKNFHHQSPSHCHLFWFPNHQPTCSTCMPPHCHHTWHCLWSVPLQPPPPPPPPQTAMLICACVWIMNNWTCLRSSVSKCNDICLLTWCFMLLKIFWFFWDLFWPRSAHCLSCLFHQTFTDVLPRTKPEILMLNFKQDFEAEVCWELDKFVFKLFMIDHWPLVKNVKAVNSIKVRAYIAGWVKALDAWVNCAFGNISSSLQGGATMLLG